MRWSVDREAATIIFHVVAEAKGYVGLGLSYAGSTMFTGDFAIGGVYDNGTTFFGVSYDMQTEIRMKSLNVNRFIAGLARRRVHNTRTGRQSGLDS